MMSQESFLKCQTFNLFLANSRILLSWHEAVDKDEPSHKISLKDPLLAMTHREDVLISG